MKSYAIVKGKRYDYVVTQRDFRSAKNRRKFWSRVERGTANACWLWQGRKSVTSGYGYVSINNVGCLAHVVAHVIQNGTVPRGHDVRHKCHVRLCMNGRHLLTGTRRQNLGDSIADDRQAREFDLPQTKLSDAQCLAIRKFLVAHPHRGAKRQLAVKYKVSESLIGQIAKNTVRLQPAALLPADRTASRQLQERARKRGRHRYRQSKSNPHNKHKAEGV